MADAKKLTQFQVKADEDGESARIHIEDDSGGKLELIATRDQLDVIAEALDDMLETTEEADEA